LVVAHGEDKNEKNEQIDGRNEEQPIMKYFIFNFAFLLNQKLLLISALSSD
jgi:hypothetical protein